MTNMRFVGRRPAWFVAIIALLNVLLIVSVVLAVFHPELIHGVPQEYGLVIVLVVTGASLVLLNAILIPMLLPATNYVELTDDCVRVVCGVFRSRIPYEQIASVRAYEFGDMPVMKPTLNLGMGLSGVVFERTKGSCVTCCPEEPKKLVREVEKRLSSQVERAG